VLTRRGPGERVRGLETAVVLGRDGGLTLSGLDRGRYDARVTSPRRLRLLGLAVALVLSGCAAATSPKPSPTGRPTAAPNLTPVPGGPSALAPASAMTTSNVEGFGAIWDAVPPSFPKLPGAIPADESKAASGLYASIIGDAPTATDTMTRALRAKGWTVDVGSPLEDGTIVLEATGAPAGCKAEIRFTPVSGSLIMEVLVGASCPFS
jgi:hypothetical protein